MSTVLHPVGPQPPRVYWIRRGVLLGIIAVVIIVLAAECSGGGGGGGGGGNHNNTAGQTPNTPSTSPTNTKPAVPACTPDDLKLTLSTDTATYTSGQAPKLIGVFANKSSTTCKLARSAADEIWTIKSGPPTIWTTDGCPSTDQIPKHMKIVAGGTKTVSTFWNGHLRTSSCQEEAVAKAGEYTLDATLDGVTGQTAVFHIKAS